MKMSFNAPKRNKVWDNEKREFITPDLSAPVVPPRFDRADEDIDAAPDARPNNFVEWTVDHEDGKGETILLPKPMGWKLLIRPRQAKKMSAGGIVLSNEVSDAEESMTFIGQVIAIGEAAFMATTQGGINMAEFVDVPDVGDWVVYAPFAGQKMRVKGDDSIFLLLNDTEIQGLVANPDDYWSWIDA